MPDPLAVQDVRPLMERVRTIAVIGAHPDRFRAAHYVPAYLAEHGYRVLPVNPHVGEAQLFGEPVVHTVADLDEPVDLVQIFRRSSEVGAHVDQVLAMDPLPKGVWLQQGIVDEDAAARWRGAGIEVVQDRCLLVDHGALGLTPRGTAA